MHLPDVNFWLALTFNRHPHHRAAVDWLDASEPRLCHFCRVTEMGFLRLATHVGVMGDDAVGMQEAWAKYDQTLTDERVGPLVAEPSGLTVLWRNHTQRRTRSHKLWTDAYLAAFAEAADLELVTFDRGFTALKVPKLTLLG